MKDRNDVLKFAKRIINHVAHVYSNGERPKYIKLIQHKKVLHKKFFLLFFPP